MRVAGLLLGAAVLAAGCGGALARPARDSGSLSAYGMSVELPAGWTGRIVLGASGRPVLHAASFALTANDTDSGEVAREAIGTANAIYLNVRNLGTGTGSPLARPVAFTASDFAPPSSDRWGLITGARREGSVDGDLFRLTAVSGGSAPPAEWLVAQANDLVLRTLTLAHYAAQAVETLPADATDIEGYGISMRLPAGWDGGVRRGELDASTSGLSLRLLEDKRRAAGRNRAVQLRRPRGATRLRRRRLGDVRPRAADAGAARARECRARAPEPAGLVSRWLDRARGRARTTAIRAKPAPRAGGRARA